MLDIGLPQRTDQPYLAYKCELVSKIVNFFLGKSILKGIGSFVSETQIVTLKRKHVKNLLLSKSYERNLVSSKLAAVN